MRLQWCIHHVTEKKHAFRLCQRPTRASHSTLGDAGLPLLRWLCSSAAEHLRWIVDSPMQPATDHGAEA